MSLESEVRASVRPGDSLPTPNARSRFLIAEMTNDAIVILIGSKRIRQAIPWSLLDEALRQVPEDAWMPVGALHTATSEDGTLEALLKPAVHRSVASYVAALFARAGLVELDTTGTHRVRRI